MILHLNFVLYYIQSSHMCHTKNMMIMYFYMRKMKYIPDF